MTQDFSVIDTTPGSGGDFAPVTGWAGSDDDYALWLGERFDSDPGFRQYFAFALWLRRKRNDVKLVGSFAVPLELAFVDAERLALQQKKLEAQRLQLEAA